MHKSRCGPSVATVVLLFVALAGAVSAQDRSTYRHPVGFSVTYPAGWRVQESDEGVVFVPADAAIDAMGQPLELFILGSDHAPGITDPADAAIVAYFQQNLPGFQMVGAPQRMDTGMGPGAVLTFEGSMGGPPLRQRTYVTVRDGKGMYLAHLATADIADRRDAEAREVFQSFRWGDAQVDPNVLGSWLQEGGSGSGGYAGDYASSGRTRQYWFRPDGTVAYWYESSVTVDVEGLSGSGGTSSEQAGTFAAGGGVLYMRFSDGEEREFRYEMVPDGSGTPVLQLTTPDGTVLNFHRQG